MAAVSAFAAVCQVSFYIQKGGQYCSAQALTVDSAAGSSRKQFMVTTTWYVIIVAATGGLEYAIYYGTSHGWPDSTIYILLIASGLSVVIVWAVGTLLYRSSLFGRRSTDILKAIPASFLSFSWGASYYTLMLYLRKSQ
jgi:hypothetical protein